MTDTDSPSEFGDGISIAQLLKLARVTLLLFLVSGQCFSFPHMLVLVQAGQISASKHVGFPLDSEEYPIIVSLFASCLPNRNVISVASKHYASAHVAVNK